METMDWIGLILGSVCLIIMLMLLKQNKSQPKVWPRIFGIGGGIFTFVLLMIGDWLLRPRSEFVDYTNSNSLLSLAISIWVYFCGHILIRRLPNEKDYNEGERK